MAERSGRPRQFDAVDDHETLIAWSRRYCERAIAVHDLAVDLGAVEWSVSTRARRRAAAVKTPPVADATVGEVRDWGDGLPDRDDGSADREDGLPDWDDGLPDRDDEMPDLDDGSPERDDGLPTCELSLSWAAFEEFDRGEWRETIRHELVHVEQFQRYGATDHGPAFRERAEAIDAPLRCRRFADAAYVLRCRDCEAVVARRYRASKLVKQPDRYRSDCCDAPLSCVEQ